jgi:Domain of unknown function (DUF4342)
MQRLVLTVSSELGSRIGCIALPGDNRTMNAQNQSSEETVEQLPVEVISPTPIQNEDERTNVEEFTIRGGDLVDKVKELIHKGNIRRIIIKNEEGRVLIEIPLTVGVVGGVLSAALFPVVAAVGVIGAMVAHLTIVIEKKEQGE